MCLLKSYPDPIDLERLAEKYGLLSGETSLMDEVEIEGHEAEPEVRRALESLGKRTTRLEILGSFPAIQEDVS